MPQFNFQFDRISFWLGFLAAILFWWAVSRIRPLLPQLSQQISNFFLLFKQRNFTSIENSLRGEVLRTAQRQHLAAPLFSLDEILIEPFLLTPPKGEDPAQPLNFSSVAEQSLPYLPDWPELVSPFGPPVISLAQALQTGRSLVFIGQPGSGKTVALAHLASLLSRQDESLGDYAGAVPLFIHAQDLGLPLLENEDALDHLLKAVTSGMPIVLRRQTLGFLQAVTRNRECKVVLLLDGLDELPPIELQAVSEFLTAVGHHQPAIQIIATASASYLDGLTRAGLYPLAVAAWNQGQREELAKRWGELWNTKLLPEVRKHTQPVEVDSILFNSWLSAENNSVTPLEWTVRLWGAYTGDVGGSTVMTMIDAHLARFLPRASFLPALESLAYHMLKRGKSALPYDEMEQFLNGLQLAAPVPAVTTPSGSAEAAAAVVSEQDPPHKEKKRSKQGRSAMQGKEIITALVEGGLLVEHANRQLRFVSPVFLGFLAGMKISSDEAYELIKNLTWVVQETALHYAAACDEEAGWVKALADEAEPPLFQPLFTVARWLRDAPPSAGWRSTVMRTLVALLQNEFAPLGIRARAVAAFYVSRDPSTAKLFKQLLTARSPILRRVALLGLGALGSTQTVNDISELLKDPHQLVRSSACLALSAIPGDGALSVIVEMLLNGDETVRQAAAEALAMNKNDGHKVLEEAAAVEDLLTRRATVYGLMQVHEQWAKWKLEKLAIEDGQWVVRNAAAQALDTLQQTPPVLPKRLVAPSQSPWLLTFASKMGLGILPGKPATDVLLAVMKSGTVDEQIAALYYLRELPGENAFSAIYSLLYSGDERATEASLHALWWMAVSGSTLPSPIQFGLL